MIPEVGCGHREVEDGFRDSEGLYLVLGLSWQLLAGSADGTVVQVCVQKLNQLPTLGTWLLLLPHLLLQQGDTNCSSPCPVAGDSV